MRIIPRASYALPAKSGITRVEMNARTAFVVHHSAGPDTQTVRAIQAHQMENRNFLDIGYNFLIRGTTGEIYEGRGWYAVGAHAKGANRDSIGVCIIGTDRLEPPAKVALRELYREACKLAGRTLMIKGHRDVDATICPGNRIYAWITSGALENNDPRFLVLRTPYLVGPDVRTVQRIVGAPVDGIFGPLTEDLVRDWQREHHLVADGIVGPKTRAAMKITD